MVGLILENLLRVMFWVCCNGSEVLINLIEISKRVFENLAESVRFAAFTKRRLDGSPWPPGISGI